MRPTWFKVGLGCLPDAAVRSVNSTEVNPAAGTHAAEPRKGGAQCITWQVQLAGPSRKCGVRAFDAPLELAAGGSEGGCEGVAVCGFPLAQIETRLLLTVLLKLFLLFPSCFNKHPLGLSRGTLFGAFVNDVVLYFGGIQRGMTRLLSDSSWAAGGGRAQAGQAGGPVHGHGRKPPSSTCKALSRSPCVSGSASGCFQASVVS